MAQVFSLICDSSPVLRRGRPNFAAAHTLGPRKKVTLGFVLPEAQPPFSISSLFSIHAAGGGDAGPAESLAAKGQPAQIGSCDAMFSSYAGEVSNPGARTK